MANGSFFVITDQPLYTAFSTRSEYITINSYFILSTIAPIFFIILLGFALKRFDIINDNFVAISSKLIFTLTLPTLIFLKVSSSSAGENIPFDVIAVIYGVTTGVFLLAWVLAKSWITKGADLGAFLQGTYRGNFATVGLAAAAGVYGSEGLLEAALLLAFVVPLFNVLGVIALVVPLGKENHLSRSVLLKEIFLNPIVLAVFIALPFAYFSIELPVLIKNTGEYLAQLTIPLALIGVGGTLQFYGRDYSLKHAFVASGIKIILMPLVGVSVALLFSLPPQTLGILFIFFACPTTMATFILAQAMGANEKLASAIVVISTCLSALTMVVGLYLIFLL